MNIQYNYVQYNYHNTSKNLLQTFRVFLRGHDNVTRSVLYKEPLLRYLSGLSLAFCDLEVAYNRL